jgi:hypothetical protein
MRRSAIGNLMVTVSPDAQVRVRAAYEPGVRVMDWATPLTLMLAPDVQLGIRTRRDQLEAVPLTVRVVVSLTGNVPLWVTVTPFCDQLTRDGMNRLRYKDDES